MKGEREVCGLMALIISFIIVDNKYNVPGSIDISYLISRIVPSIFFRTPQNQKSLLILRFAGFLLVLVPFCGEWGIRTRGPFNKSTVFKTAAIDHSANSPVQKYKLWLILQTTLTFFLYKVDNYLTQREKKLFSLDVFVDRIAFFEKVVIRPNNFNASLAYIDTGVELKTDQ